MGRQDFETETLLAVGGFPDVAHALRADGFDASEDGTGRGTPLVTVAPTLTSNGDAHSGYRDERGLVPMAFNLRGRDGGSLPEMSDVASLRAASGGSSRSYVADMAVRRLTPRECERLQGFPDDYTLVPFRKKLAADWPRYKALGNSKAVPVVRWIGERIQKVEELG
jgi:DNA (cytosine-5)-methyltransferase 1